MVDENFARVTRHEIVPPTYTVPYLHATMREGALRCTYVHAYEMYIRIPTCVSVYVALVHD